MPTGGAAAAAAASGQQPARVIEFFRDTLYTLTLALRRKGASPQFDNRTGCEGPIGVEGSTFGETRRWRNPNNPTLLEDKRPSRSSSGSQRNLLFDKFHQLIE
uniref:Uncharacterized protein n=1 Tax=Anopheles coluzzii TaxID=1518534 RepID=A0A8W7PB25_ANOCL